MFGDFLKNLQGKMEDTMAKWDKEAFAEAAMTLAAGGVAADGQVDDEELAVVFKAIRTNKYLQLFDRDDLLSRFKKALAVYQANDTMDRMDMEECLQKIANNNQEKMTAVAIALSIVAKGGIEESEKKYMDRVCGPNVLNVDYNAL